MTSEKEYRLALRLAIILFVVGVLSYLAFPVQKAEPPVRISYFDSKGGKVIFGHSLHAEDLGYVCLDCHHPHPWDEDDPVDITTEGKIWSCGVCHDAENIESLPDNCWECHGEGDFYIEDIGGKTPKILHDQCIGCHKDEGAGPVECKACHMI